MATKTPKAQTRAQALPGGADGAQRGVAERSPKTPTGHKVYEQKLREIAMSYPEVSEDFPWGHSAFKVKGKKAFLFMGGDPDKLSLSLKLPESRHAALMMPFAEPTGYGLGKSGWVSSTFPNAQKPPMEILAAWIDESYRAVAPVKLVKALDARGQGEAAEASTKAGKKAPAAKKKAAPARKPAAKKKVPAKKKAPAPKTAAKRA